MEVELRIKKFIDEVVIPHKNPLPRLPSKFRENPENREEWDDWLELESSVTDSDLEEIEKRFQIILPELLKSYFKYKVIFDGDFGICRFPDMRPDSPLENLISQIKIMNECSFFRNNKLVPFAQDGNDGGPICFKYDTEGIAKGFPIYFTDHELIYNQNYKGELIYESFILLIDAIEKDMKSYD